MVDKKWVKVEMSDAHDFEKEKILIGVLTSSESEVGPNDSWLYTFEKKDGKKVSVWGSAVLDTRLKNVSIGSEVKIVYKGTVKNEKSGRTFKDYNIFIST